MRIASNAIFWRVSLRSKFLLLIGLGLAGLALTACGAAVPNTWPGLVANDTQAFIANGDQVHAINLTDGKKAWAFPPQADGNTGYFQTDPGLSADLLVVGAEGPASSYSGAIYALNVNDGTQKWCLVFDQKAVDRLRSANCRAASTVVAGGFFGIGQPAADNRPLGGIVITDATVYFGLSSGRVFAVNADTGEEKWNFATARDVWGAPAVTAEAVYVSSLDQNLYAINRATGALLWQKDLGSASAGTPLVADGVLYIGVFGNQLLALDAATGEQHWAFATSNWVWGGPTLAEGTLYFSDVSGMIYAVTAANGQQVWATALNQAVRGQPAAKDDLVFIGDRNGALYALNRATGALTWQQSLKGQLLASPVLVGDLVLVAPFSGDNLLMAYGVNNTLKWAFAPSR
jgi:outer membrane protein assembly factor BamB